MIVKYSFTEINSVEFSMLGFQVGVVVISRAFHLYDPDLFPGSACGLRFAISICLHGLFSGYSGFPPSANSTFTPRSEPSSD